MKIGSLGVTVLALGAALPAFAQQGPGSQQDARQQQVTHQQVEAWVNQWGDAYNRGDVQAVLAMSDPDACFIDVTGKVCGLTNIGPRIEAGLKMGPHVTFNVDGIRSMGRGAVTAVGTYRVTYRNNPAGSEAEGNWLAVLEREGAAWKSVAASFTRLVAPAASVATGSTEAQPTTGTSAPPATPPAAPPAPAAGPKYDPTSGMTK